MTKREFAKEYRLKYPNKPTLALARIMYAENKLLFSGVEHCRTVLRQIEGKAGGKNIKTLKDRSLVLDTPRPLNPYNLPDSDETSYKPFILKGHKKIAIFSDIHLPYHSISAITAALQFAKKEKVDGLILNGDTLDCHHLSRFERDPTKKNFAEELEILKTMIAVFKKELKCKIYMKMGNHSERYEHFLMMKAGELIGVEEFRLENIIKSRVKDIEVIKDKRLIYANGLTILHGHEFGQGFFSPVNVARGLALRAKTSAIQGHNHQVSEHTSVDIRGKVMTTWSLGCLCELSPKFLPINNWAHGFAIVDLDAKDFHVRNFRILNGVIL